MSFSFWNSFIIVFAAFGPIVGNPSRMNCFCSSSVLLFFVCLMEYSLFELFSYFFARLIRNFDVSFSFFVYIIGILKSVAIESSIPLIAFS